MPKTLVLPDFDLPTRSATGWLIRWIAPRLEPAHLYGPLARGLPFRLSLRPSDLIIGVGHGNPSEFSGQNEALLVDAANLPNVKGKVIVLISCQTAQKLGPALVSAGASFIGFREDVLWLVDADMAAMPWRDKYAEPVMMPIVDCLNSILDGKSAEEAFQRLNNSFNSRLATQEDELSASMIAWNLKSARLLGDASVTVSRRPALPLPFRVLPPPPMVLPIKY